jgi:hypothetical protein
MSTKEVQPEVFLNELTFSFEDMAKIDAILGAFPYRSVKPIYDIIEKRMLEQGEARLKEIEAKKSPEATAMPTRERIAEQG